MAIEKQYDYQPGNAAAFGAILNDILELRPGAYKVYICNTQDNPPPQLQKYYNAVILEAIRDETGENKLRLHQLFKLMFNPVFTAQAEPEPGTTTELDAAGYWRYIEEILAFAGSVLGLTIPPPHRLPNETLIKLTNGKSNKIK